MYKPPVGAGRRSTRCPTSSSPARWPAASTTSSAAGLPRARGEAHPDPQGAGHRRPQDVEVLRQRDLPVRHPGEITAKIRPMIDRPRAQAPHRPRESRRLPGLRPSPHLHAGGGPGTRWPTGCRTAGIGCLDCKGVLLEHMLRTAREDPRAPAAFADRPAALGEILRDGLAPGPPHRPDATEAMRRGDSRCQGTAETTVAPAAAHRPAWRRSRARSTSCSTCAHERDRSRAPAVRPITDQYLAYLESMEFRDLDDGRGVPGDGRDADLPQVEAPAAAPGGRGPLEADDEGEALRRELASPPAGLRARQGDRGVARAREAE